MRNIRNGSVCTALPFESCFVARAVCFYYKVRLMPEAFGRGFLKVKRRSEYGKNGQRFAHTEEY